MQCRQRMRMRCPSFSLHCGSTLRDGTCHVLRMARQRTGSGVIAIDGLIFISGLGDMRNIFQICTHLCCIAYQAHHPDRGLEQIKNRNFADGAACSGADGCYFENTFASRFRGKCGGRLRARELWE